MSVAYQDDTLILYVTGLWPSLHLFPLDARAAKPATLEEDLQEIFGFHDDAGTKSDSRALGVFKTGQPAGDSGYRCPNRGFVIPVAGRAASTGAEWAARRRGKR